MIEHIVLLKYKKKITNKVIGKQMESLAKIPGVLTFYHGKNCSPEGLGRDFNYGFIAKFKDKSALLSYLNHPEHIKIAEDHLIASQENGKDSLLVYDIEYLN